MCIEVGLAASELEKEDATMKSVFKRLLSRGVADRLKLAMRTAGSVLAVVILLMPVSVVA